MNFTHVVNMLKDASPYELYRLRAALKIEMENPEKIKALYHSFAVGDKIAYFNGKKNCQCPALVLEKNTNHVIIKDLQDHTVWNTPYYAINITGQDSCIYANKNEKLSRNNLQLGELVGFMHEGKQHVGQIKKLNPKSVSLITQDNKRWLVGYEWLFKIVEGEIEQIAQTNLIEDLRLSIEGEIVTD